MPRSFRAALAASSLLALLSLSACGQKAAGTADGSETAGATADVALPKPEAAKGSVTGMPSTPGPRPIGPALVAPPASASVADVATGDIPTDTATDADAGDATVATDVPAASSEPGVQDAVAVVRDYYAAIEQHDYAHAWSLWSDGGRSSGQTAQQFADGFANTAHVVVQAGAPGRLDAAAGSRYIEIPVTVEAAQRDGSVRRYAGSYTLRRAVVDGASAEQRAWRIASADLRQLTQ